jgi:nitrite reductase (NADH) large subunit
VCDGRRLVGVVVVGPWPELPRIQEVIDSRRRLSHRRIEAFTRSGLLWPGQQMGHVAEWPAGAMVCNCLQVDKKCLSRALHDGCATVEALSKATGASTVCGSCKPLLAQLVGAPPASVAAAGWKWLLIASVLSALLAMAISLVPAIPPAQTVQGGWKWEALWRDPFWKQVTGFTMLGLIVLSLAMSMRKRIRWLRVGEFGWWRALHGILGLFCVAVLVTHTGFSLGKNLNYVLMLNFLLLAAWGGLAGLVTALEHRFTGYVGLRIRRLWQWLHIALIWPLPPLLAFHVIAFYWF